MRKRYAYYKKFELRFPKKKYRKDDTASSNPPPPPPPPPPWVELPRDITANILGRLGTIEVLQSALKVCTTWRSVCRDPAMWRVIDFSDCDGVRKKFLKAMCRSAVDLSHGQLVDICIEYFASDKLLLYIAQRANQLRFLRLVSCNAVSSDCLIKAVTQFPFLQELHIYNYNFKISNEDIKTIGRSCPLLTSFTLNKYEYESAVEFDDQALAVAENMRGLCHLALIGNMMTNHGVKAILDGCPHLESLDFRGCFNVTLEGDLRKRCSKQIKDLKSPNDATSDTEFCSDEEDYGDFDDAYSSDGFCDSYDFDYDESECDSDW